MATFGAIQKGTRARKRVKLPLAGATLHPETFEFEGDVVEVELRALTPLEHTEVLAAARAFAISKGVANPSEEDAIYEQALILERLVRACVDPDSPPDDPRPFFDGGFEQLHTTELLSNDHIAYLNELQMAWEDEVSPRLLKLSDAEFMAGVIKTAAGDSLFFASLRRGTLWSFTRTLAKLHLDSLTRSSSPGLGSVASGTG